MAAKKYTIVFRNLMQRQKRQTHETYSKEIHEKTLSMLRGRKFCEIVEVRVNGKKVEV